MQHTPVLLEELVKLMDIKPEGVYVDCTGGGGGHAVAILSQITGGRLIILDRDVEAIERLNDIFAGDGRVKIIHANFADIDKVLEELGIEQVDGIYADFGVSSFQLNSGYRGFSFRNEGAIDMRMDTTEGVSASEVVNDYNFETIATIIAKYGEERFAKRIANEIVKRRAIKKFTVTSDLAEVVKQAVPKKFHKKGIHPATQTFQALRIYVNKELEAISLLMQKIVKVIKVGGRFCAISFHSLEDRRVKDQINEYAKDCICPPSFPACACSKRVEFKVITRKPVIASDKELLANPLSRSAKLRACERV